MVSQSLNREYTTSPFVGRCAKYFFGGNMEDERLERLSDLVRQGVPIDLGDALEVIDYQESKKVHRTTGLIRRFAKWLSRHFV